MTYTQALPMAGTFSKHPWAWGLPSGLAVRAAEGCMVKLNSGDDWFFDWVCGLGPNILGYGQHNLRWYEAVKEQLKNGAAFSLPHVLETEVAELLRHLIAEWRGHSCKDPHELQVRFCKTGTEANTMAVRLARAVTGREGIIAFDGGYHGWADWSQDNEPAHGVTVSEADHIARAVFNEPGSLVTAANGLKREGIRPAAVIIEHPLQEPDRGFYDAVRSWCNVNGALFIMDEVVTGLRFGGGGASGYYGANPDLVTMGKALGNGLPIAALVGHKETMQWFARIDPVFCSSTFWGEAVGLAGAKAVLEQVDSQFVKRLQRINNEIADALTGAGWTVKADKARSLLTPTNDSEAAFIVHGFFEVGHLVNRPQFACLAQDDIGAVLALSEAATIVRQKYLAALERGTLAKQVQGKFGRRLFSNR